AYDGLKADQVVALIEAIGDVDLDKEDEITAARNGYDALTDAQKTLVGEANYQKLADAEAALAKLKADHAAADDVIGLINAIGEVTLDKEDQISAARTAYDALTDDQKGLIDAATLKELTDAESALVTLKADKAAADDVVVLIDAIGEVSFDKEDEITAARKAYDALTDGQKAFVSEAKLQVLIDAENALETLKADKAAADAVIGQINAIGEVTLEKENAIVAARAAFEALTDAQKAYVDADTLSKLTAAEVAIASLKGDQAAADAVIGMINGIGEVSLAKENTIVAARNAYDALTDKQKALIDAATLKILTDAEGTLATMKADKAKADEVIAMINGIGEVTLEKESAILAARDAYDALSNAQKAYIDQATLKKLTDAEGTLAALKGDEAAVAYVEGLIDKIGEVTLEKENAIVTARNAYDTLTDHQKELLSPASLQKLVAAETALTEIKADKAEADKVRFMIEALGDVTLDKEGVIVSAREAYEALSARAKSFLDEATLQTLLDAESALADLKAEKAAIDHAKELIDSIGEVTLEKEGLIAEARAAYDALTDAQKERISEYLVNTLNNAEKILASLKADKAATDAFKALVDGIGEIDDSEACRKRIEAAKAAYDALTDEQKAAVASEYQTLLRKEADHNKVVNDKRTSTILLIVGIAAGGVVALLLLLYAVSFLLLRKFVIDPLNEKPMRVVSVKKKAGIATLLTPRLKKLCYPEGELYRSKKEALSVSALSKAERDDVLNAIHAIGEVSLEKEEEIRLARKALDALPDPQKAKIDASDIHILEVAKETLASLKAKASAKHVETLIRQMSKEEEANPATIEMARKAYDALSESEKSYLSSYSLAKLEEAEALLRDAPKEEVKKKKDPKDEEE
ncbi:MAG: hypothetical protein IJS52_10990, partial [Bacilli bacterium]|nr:hypothetical protein [Bacilli bacterium]